jgi:hypothetical protein
MVISDVPFLPLKNLRWAVAAYEFAHCLSPWPSRTPNPIEKDPSQDIFFFWAVVCRWENVVFLR